MTEVLHEAKEFVLELDRPELYRMYLEENIQDFMKHYWEQTFFCIFRGDTGVCSGQALHWKSVLPSTVSRGKDTENPA